MTLDEAVANYGTAKDDLMLSVCEDIGETGRIDKAHTLVLLNALDAAVRNVALAVRDEVLNRLYATYHPLTTLSDPPELNVELMQRDPDWYWLTPRVADERCSEAVGAEIDQLLGPEKAGV